MGYSLGGVMAAGYLDGRARSWDGLVLLGAYSTADLSDDGVTVLSITGDSDGVLDRQAVVDSEGNLGEDAREFVIPGGNHAQFGSYGPQDGDGEATSEKLAMLKKADAMTADWAKLLYDALGRISSRIVAEVAGINHVVYDITSKPPSAVEGGGNAFAFNRTI